MSKLVNQTLHVLKSSSDTVKALIVAHDLGAVAEISLELNGQIASTQTLVLALQQEQAEFIAKVSELEKQVSDFNNWETERQRYEMKKLEPGIIMYSLKEGSEGNEPDHNICADCYNNGKKSILHMVRENQGLSTWKCNVCGFEEKTGKFIRAAVSRGGGSRFGR